MELEESPGLQLLAAAAEHRPTVSQRRKAGGAKAMLNLSPAHLLAGLLFMQVQECWQQQHTSYMDFHIPNCGQLLAMQGRSSN